jgi:5'-methylthioadenosine phosphorylase
MIKVGIIGGSGLDNPDILGSPIDVKIGTPYGNPSSPLTCGKIKSVDVAILARHGKDHSISPSNVNFRANIWALKEYGCTHILAATAVGSLRREIEPGHLVFPDQFIDFTKKGRQHFSMKILLSTLPWQSLSVRSSDNYMPDQPRPSVSLVTMKKQ